VAGVNVYVKRKLRLDLLNVTQRQMYDLGNKALKAVKYRIDRHQDSRDMPAPPLKSKSWRRIKLAKGLKPYRDMRGTGMWKNSKTAKIKFVGHLMDEGNISVRKVSDNFVLISPSKVAMRTKFAGNRNMFEFSPSDTKFISDTFRRIFGEIKNKLIKSYSKG
jgi:hypothetical protein